MITSVKSQLIDKADPVLRMKLNPEARSLLIEMLEFTCDLEDNDVISRDYFEELLDILGGEYINGIDIDRNSTHDVNSELIAKLSRLRARSVAVHADLYERCMLKRCLDKLSHVNYPVGLISADCAYEKLKEMSEGLGLQFYEAPIMDLTSAQTVTICGVVFVLDICISSTGSIDSLELSYAIDTIPRSPRANALLANLLREGNYSGFMRELRHFCLLDYTSRFELIKSVESSIHDNFRNQLKTSEDKKSYTLYSLYHGPGLLVEDYERIGLCFIYQASPLLNIIASDKVDWGSFSDEDILQYAEYLGPKGVYKAYLRLAGDQSIHSMAKNKQKLLNSALEPSATDAQEPQNDATPASDKSETGRDAYLLFEVQLHPTLVLTEELMAEIFQTMDFAQICPTTNCKLLLGTPSNLPHWPTISWVLLLKPYNFGFLIYNKKCSILSVKVKDPEGAAFYCATQDDSHIQKYLLPHKLDSLDLYATLEYLAVDTPLTRKKTLRRVCAFMLLLESCFTSEGFNFGYTSRDLLATKHEVEIEIAKFDFGKKLVFEFSHPSRSIRVSLKIVVGSMNVCTAQDLYNLNRIPAYSPIDVECIAYNAQSMDPSEIITLSDPYWDRFLESFLNIPLLVSSIISKLS